MTRSPANRAYAASLAVTRIPAGQLTKHRRTLRALAHAALRETVERKAKGGRK